MPPKRSVDDISAMIDKRFAEFKAGLLEDLSKDIQEFVDERKGELMNEVNSFFEKKSKDINKIGELATSISAIQKHVKKLELSENMLVKENNCLSERIENLEQYGRRCNLRIYGIPLEGKETSDNIRNKILEIKSNANIDIPDYVIDRAHRVGKIVTTEGGVRKQAVIVRFNNFRTRTIFYKARKDTNVGVSLDLTKDRLTLLKEARNKVENLDFVKFVYADTNCSLRIFTDTKKYIAFKSLEDLDKLISES